MFPQPLLVPAIAKPRHPPAPLSEQIPLLPITTAAAAITIITEILNSHGQAEEKPLSEKSLPSSPSLLEEQMKKSNLLRVSEWQLIWGQRAQGQIVKETLG